MKRSWRDEKTPGNGMAADRNRNVASSAISP
jgi:hypothetical protein